MRKQMLLAILVLLVSVATAQNDAATGDFSPSTAIKWNPLSIYFGKVSLLGEYNFRHNSSVTFALGIPFTKNSTFEINDKDRDIAMKTFSVMGGYRLYFGNKAMRGFYFEPYLKYVKSDGATIINEDLNGTPTDFVTSSKYAGFGLGAQLGVQFWLAKRVTLDLLLIGPEANTVKHTAVLTDITTVGPWDANDAADAERIINDNIGDLILIGDKINVVVDAQSKTARSDYKGFLPGFRAGLSIGFRF